MFLRLNCICSSPDDFEHKARNMYIDFQQTAYPTGWLYAALEMVRNMDVSHPSTHNLTIKMLSHLYHHLVSPEQRH